MNDEIIEEFRIEAAEMFESAEDGFLNLEKGENFSENFNLIFRAFHSLKGAAGMFGLTDLQSHMHKLESLFEAQKACGTMDKTKVDYFLAGVDAAKSILDGKNISFAYVEDFNTKPATETKTKTETVALKVEPERKPLPVESKKKTTRGVVFIVDDQQDVIDILEQYLQPMNFEIHTFLRAEEALVALPELNPSMILSDIAMPEMDGIEFVRQVRGRNQSVPIIMVSGELSKQKILNLLKYDVYGFIEKPFVEKDIEDVCESAFNLSQLNTLLYRSINYIIYQFSDLDNYLKTTGKENIRVSLKEELKNIVKIQKELNEKKKTLSF